MEALLFKQQLKRNQVCSYYHPTFFEFEGVNTGNEEVRLMAFIGNMKKLIVKYDGTNSSN